jgi:tRNA (mo5U34)-methyltransferase
VLVTVYWAGSVASNTIYDIYPYTRLGVVAHSPAENRLQLGELFGQNPEGGKPHMSEQTELPKGNLEQLVAEVPFWWHSIEIGQGIVTPGVKTPGQHQRELESYHIPDLHGKTVLDIGAWDGFHSFDAEQRGARRVVALDHYVWSVDFDGFRTYSVKRKQQGLPARVFEETPYWKPDTLPGMRGFHVARAARGSRVESVVADFMKMDVGTIGTFDVVFFFGVLYHMRDPLGSLTRLAQVTAELAIIETHAFEVRGLEDRPLWEFYPADELNHDPTNWFCPNTVALSGACRAAGFKRVEIISSPPPSGERLSLRERMTGVAAPGKPQYFRAVAHAWK